jgi:UDP-N-acetylmuramoyl-L-alanine---L-glutamate ligase
VRSPGVSIYRPELQAVLAGGTPVTTATSLWLAERGGAGVLGVTGTKGKSTTAALALHLARAAGLTAQLAGNIGVPALDLLDREAAEVTVLELSSYHTADLEIGPEVALVTNLYREHTDWHGSEQAYRADKLRLLGLPGVRVAVLSARDERLAETGVEVETRRFGVPGGWDATAAGIALRGELQASSDELPLRGEHNVLNLCAALTALEALGVEPAPLPAALDGFRALPHRLETVAERDHVEWVNDSISTTPESAIAALASFPGRELVLIAGGQDRGQDYSRLADALAAADATVIGVPTTGPRLVAAARSAGVASARAIDAPDLAAAVELARSLAAEGSAVLLSPAAPSFDRYGDFEERGERFSELARSR